MTERLRVGFVGLGDMGEPMVHHIVKAGFTTTLWARREASLKPFVGTSFRKAADLVELGKLSDIVGVCVFDDNDVREVVLGNEGVLSGMGPESIILIHSTASVEVCEEIDKCAREKGIRVLDAPLSGTRIRADQGELSVLVGGERSAFEEALPVMQSYGKVIEHLGPIGSGQKMKILNNVLASVNLRMAHLALQIGTEMGLDKDAIISILRTGSASSFIFGFLVDYLLPNPEYARHATKMTEKDTQLFQKTRADEGIGRSRLDEIAEEAIDLMEQLGQK